MQKTANILEDKQPDQHRRSAGCLKTKSSGYSHASGTVKIKTRGTFNNDVSFKERS